MEHPLRELRESAGCTQLEIAQRSGLSANRISLIENFLTVATPKEDQAIRKSILELTKTRASEVLREADPRFAIGLKTIEASPTKRKLFKTLLESQKYSEHECVVIVLGRSY